MLSIYSRNKGKFCDGMSRRGFLRVGGLSLGGASLPQILSAETSLDSSKSGLGHKAVIMIFLAGGPPHQDMWDIKRDAPTNIRGEFNAIKTNVSGIEICELFPKIARMADKFAFIRSIVGAQGGHDAQQCLTGRSPRNAPAGGWPSIGSVMSSVQGSASTAVPAFVGLSPKCGHDQWGDPGQSGFCGPSHSAFTPNRGGGASDVELKGISLERLGDRQSLLKSVDCFRRDVDASGVMGSLDDFNNQAYGVLTSSKLAEAFDLSKEDPKLVERYGKGTEKLTADGPWKRLDQFLMARRLVEAGARCVTIGFSRWDWHGSNFKRAKEDFPLLDQGVTSLVQDLHDRGLDKDVSVIVWGEFGRTPVINKNAGRDHWPKVSNALIAGGGMRTGQIIGSTTRDGGEADDRPVTFQEVFATLYHSVGIDVSSATVNDLNGRPRYLVDQRYKPMLELV
ncbi:MAG TPA: DUF1501 domain-containing protein [Verrucomicrobia bacterium]|nr:DUF1501 domain-containing protein [Verrucomicrobiales bacterium]HIL54526.1 DUF1501 domain-containing protein [Verrucomicrobiota bacterium]